MGLESLSFSLAWMLARTAVQAAVSIGNLINQPAVLLGAAAVVVIAVLIVLIMVLRGGSKKAELALDPEEGDPSWESAPHEAASQAGKRYGPQDQMPPWEQGGEGRVDGGRQQVGGRRGAAARDDQPGWEQPDDYAARDAQWEAQRQPSPRGGQWVGTDEWAPAAPAGGRGGPEERTPQGQMAPHENDGWGWGANQSPSSGPNAHQWSQGAAPSSPVGREGDQWSQRKSAPLSPMGRENDEWGQGPAVSHPMGRENDGWGQGVPARGRGQDQWGQPSPAMGRGTDYSSEDQNAGMRGGPRRTAEPAGQPEGQWNQGNWGQGGAAWGEGGATDRWGQPAQQPPSSWSSQPVPSRPISQGNMAAQQPAGQGAGGEWGERAFERPASGGAPSGGSWGGREAPAWQASSSQEPPAWESSGWDAPESEQAASRGGQRAHSSSRPQWEQAGRAPAEGGWESAGAANEWGQPAPAPTPSASRPIEPASARGMGQSPAAGGEWGERDFERPTSRPMPSGGGWDQREAPARQPTPESAPPAWQAPAPQMAASSGQVEAPPDRRGPDMRQISRVSPESTAYAPPAPGGESESEAAKTIVARKDTGAARALAVVVRQGKEPGRTYDVRKDHISIGRSRESDIFLEDLAVSRLHATIYRDEMGGYLLRDENSANGTSVNGQRITECALQEGDEIQLGQTILAFVRH
jgi:hypothetical protein